MKTNKSIINVISLEDDLSHWDSSISSFVKKIETVYFFDSSVITHCAEITPSFYLTPLYYIVTPLHEGDEEIVEKIEEVFYNEEPKYFNHQIIKADSLVRAENCEFEYGEFDDEDYKEGIEEVEEYLKCNHVI